MTPRTKYGVGPSKPTDLHSSLPKGIKDSSYFDMNEQRRSLLNQFKVNKFEDETDLDDGQVKVFEDEWDGKLDSTGFGN